MLHTDESPLLAIEKDGYFCAACNALALVYLPNDSEEIIRIEAVDRCNYYPTVKLNEIVTTPVVRVAPRQITFCPQKAAIVELKTTVKFMNSKISHNVFPLFSGTDFESSPQWAQLNSEQKCEINSDRVMFMTSKTGLFTAVTQFSTCNNSVTVKPETKTSVEFALPGYKVEIPPFSTKASTEVLMSVDCDETESTASIQGKALASPCFEFKPPNHQLNNKMKITIPIPFFQEIQEQHPEANLLIWHTPNNEAPNEWEIFPDSNLSINKDENGEHILTFDTSLLTKYGCTWSIAENFELMEKIIQFYANRLVEREIKSMSGRCQVFMSSEENVELYIIFSIAALVYPFQDPYDILKNYRYCLYDSGHIPVEFNLGTLNFKLNLEDYIFFGNDGSNERQKSLSKSAKLSLNHVARADFPVRLHTSARLKDGLLAQLKIFQDSDDDVQLDCNLIKVSQSYTVVKIFNIVKKNNTLIILVLTFESLQPCEALTSIDSGESYTERFSIQKKINIVVPYGKCMLDKYFCFLLFMVNLLCSPRKSNIF